MLQHKAWKPRGLKIIQISQQGAWGNDCLQLRPTQKILMKIFPLNTSLSLDQQCYRAQMQMQLNPHSYSSQRWIQYKIKKCKRLKII